jgi:hypothetical protein
MTHHRRAGKKKIKGRSRRRCVVRSGGVGEWIQDSVEIDTDSEWL